MADRPALPPALATLRQILVRALVTAGIALAGWLLTAAFNAPASAAAPGSVDGAELADVVSERAPAEAVDVPRAGGSLLGAIGGVGSVTESAVGTATSTVGTVSSTATNTVGTAADTVGATVDTTVKTVNTTVKTVTTTVSSLEKAAVGTITDTSSGLVSDLPSAPRPNPPADDATAGTAETTTDTPPARSERSTEKRPKAPRDYAKEVTVEAPPTPVVNHFAAPRKDGVSASPAHQQQAPQGPLAPPAPAAPAGAGSTVAHAAHDNGGHKQHAATLSSDSTEAQLRLLGTSQCRPVFGAGRAAALPCTTPD